MTIYTSKNIFYVYAYLRSKDSSTASKGTPYYIGKGSNGRYYEKHGKIPVPKDKSNIIFYGKNLIESVSFDMEKFLIAFYGRIDLGTGILRNRTDGGEGVSGRIASIETRAKLSVANKGENNPRFGKLGTMFGKHHSDESKAKQALVKNGKYTGENNPMYGKQHSLESKSKMSAVKKGEKNNRYGTRHSKETKEKMSAVKKGKQFTVEHKAKLSAAKLAMPIVECPHCGKLGKGTVMKQWHFDNCKYIIS